MEIKLAVNDAETLATLRGLSVEGYVEAWAEAIYSLARKSARDRIGGNFGSEIANTVRQDSHGLTAEIYSIGRIGTHVHNGGPIQSSNGKVLAIPSRWNPRRDLFARNWLTELVLIKSKARNRAYLFEKPAPGKKLGRPLFFLTPKTKPQKPRPWWPDETAVETETIRFFDENF